MISSDPVRLALALLIAGAASMGLASCSNADGATEAVPDAASSNTRVVQVETMAARRTSFNDVIVLTGTVEALQDVNLSAEVAGQLSYVAPLGTRVGRGSVVARTDDRLLQSALDAARAQYELAEDTFKRQEALFRDSVISALEFESARAQRDQLQALYRQAQKQLEDTRLASPIAGRVEERFVESGEMVSPGTPVVRIVNTNRVKIRTGIPERYAGDVEQGSTVAAGFSAYGQGAREGEIAFVSNVIDPKSRTFAVEIEFDNTDRALKPEMVADLSIVRSRIDSALVVPQTAAIRDEAGVSLFVVVSRDGRLVAERRAVELGPRFAGRTVVESGLQADEQVVVVGQSTLADGDVVAVENTFDSADAYIDGSGTPSR